MDQKVQLEDIEHEEVIDERITGETQKRDNRYSTISENFLYLKEIGQYPILTPEEEKQLAQEIANGNNMAKEKFIKSNLRLVVYTAKKYRISELDFLDLIQEGNIGLLRAVEMFDYTKGVKFSTYATYWIKQAILRFISNQKELIRIPTKLQEVINQYQAIQSNFYKKNMRYATDFEMSKEMKISINEVDEIKSYIYSIVSLNAPVSFESDDELGDFIKDTDLTPEEVIIKKCKRESLEILINNSNLKEREMDVIRMRFDFEHNKCNSLKSIAKKLGISQERVRNIEKTALMKLRVTARREYSREFFM